jgi:Domain of unknown function (DUF4878)
MNLNLTLLKTTFLSLCLILIFAACNEPQTQPAEVLDNMFTAMKKGNIEEMKNYITKQDIAFLDAAEKIMTQADPEGMQKIKGRMIAEFKERAKDLQYSFKDEKIVGNHATVEAEIIDKNPAGETGGKRITHTFELVNENNTWKIALSKPGNEMFNSMKGNMGSRKGDLKTGFEKLKKMDPDSLKMLIGKGVRALDSLEKKKND